MRQEILLIFGIITLFFIVGCTGQTIKEIDVSGNLVETTASIGLNNGNLAPDFSITTIDGEEIQLHSSFENKPVLVYFMATWCPYCKSDFNALSKVYNDYENDVEILSISLDLNEGDSILESYKNQFPGIEKVKFAKGNMDVLTKYKVKTTTTKYALAKDGTIIYSGSGAINQDQWRTLLDALKEA